MKKSLITLDCTLRDGGYYNSWDFDTKTVSRYLQSIGAAGVDAIEIGFRFPPKNKFLGAFAYSSDHFLKKLPLPKSCQIAVMINAKDMLSYDGGPKQAVREMFDKAENSPVSIVRMCSYFDEVEKSKPIMAELKALGYSPCYNLMQVTENTNERLAEVTKEIASWATVDVLYFADSLGAMDESYTKKVVATMRKYWNGPIGIHAHNNKGQATANSLAAVDNDVQWIDGTILGMGRGAGNASTEYLLLGLKEKGFDKYNPEAVFTIVMEDFKDLQKQYGWGSNLLYYLSANYGIHPTYVQEMISSLHYDTDQIFQALNTLKKWGANSYSQDNLKEAMLGGVDTKQGSWSAKDWVKDKDVLVIGAGPNAKTHTEALEDFIDTVKPYVISLNSEPNISSKKVDAYAVCHYTRLMTELDQYTNLARPILMPYGVLPEAIRNKVANLSIMDYGIKVKSHSFQMQEKNCVIPGFLVAPYVFAAATMGGAKRIFLAGFDGFGPADPRQEEMLEVINLYKACENSIELIAVTPSTYNIKHSSVYALTIK